MNTLPILPNRLAYPEHIPEQMRERYLYNDFDGLCLRLEAAIRGVAQFREGIEMDELKDYVAKYDWSSMVCYYDDEFECVVKGIINLP